MSWLVSLSLTLLHSHIFAFPCLSWTEIQRCEASSIQFAVGDVQEEASAHALAISLALAAATRSYPILIATFTVFAAI